MPFYISSHFLLAHPLPSSTLCSCFPHLYYCPISTFLNIYTPISLYLTPIFSTLLYPYVPTFHPHVSLHYPQFSISLHCQIQCYIIFPIPTTPTLVFPLPPCPHAPHSHPYMSYLYPHAPISYPYHSHPHVPLSNHAHPHYTLPLPPPLLTHTHPFSLHPLPCSFSPFPPHPPS